MSSDAQTPAAIAIDGDRLWRELDELAQFSTLAAPAVTRIVFSDADHRAREDVKALCREAFLEIDGRRRDAALAVIRQACENIAARRRVLIVIETINADAPCQCAHPPSSRRLPQRPPHEGWAQHR